MTNLNETLTTLRRCGLPNFLKLTQKKHLVITGRKQVGKSTLFRQICPPNGPGIRTYRTDAPAVFLENMATGQTGLLGLPATNRMRLQPGILDQLALPILAQTPPVFYLDEIGYLECGHPAYCQGLLRLLDTTTLVAVLRKEDTPLSRAILQRDDVFLIDLDGYWVL